MEILARGTSASLGVGDDRQVVQRVKLYMCVRGHLTACREKQINRKMKMKMLASVR